MVFIKIKLDKTVGQQGKQDMGFDKGPIRRGEFVDAPKVLYLAMAFFNLSTKRI
jgi:hypothetical protein